jgi:hypothetical protein
MCGLCGRRRPRERLVSSMGLTLRDKSAYSSPPSLDDLAKVPSGSLRKSPSRTRIAPGCASRSSAPKSRRTIGGGSCARLGARSRWPRRSGPRRAGRPEVIELCRRQLNRRRRLLIAEDSGTGGLHGSRRVPNRTTGIATRSVSPTSLRWGSFQPADPLTL